MAKADFTIANIRILKSWHYSFLSVFNLVLKPVYSSLYSVTLNYELLIGFGPNYNAPNLSFEGSLVEAASNLFSFLAKYQKKYSKIAIAPIPNKGIGRAINDRIKRATSKN